MLELDDIEMLCSDNEFTAGGRFNEGLLEKPVIIFGAGTMGKLICDLLLGKNITPAFFIDHASSLTDYKDIPVVSPDSEAITDELRREAIVVIAIVSFNDSLSIHFQNMKNKIEQYGYTNFYYFTQIIVYLSKKFADFSWYYIKSNIAELYKKNIDAINRSMSLMSDDASKKAFEGLLKFCLSGKLEYYEGAPDLPSGDPQYFLDSIYDLSKVETYIDIGAYTGDTLEKASKLCSGLKTAYCFEPSQNLFSELISNTKDKFDNLKLHCLPLGCSDKTDTKYFKKYSMFSEMLNQATSSEIASDNIVAVQCVRLDECLSGVSADLIKLDIEGSEEGALRGASSMIAESTPVVAVCVYHKPDDVWTMINLLDDSAPGEYSFYLRKFGSCSWMECVVYAVPARLAVN